MGETTRVQGTNNKLNAVFTDKKDNSQLSQSDFLKLMVAQMQNQDFTNPMDNSQMVQQMVAFSNMQQMQEMTSYSKTNYAMSLVGKTVTASRYNVSGNLDTTTGTIDKVSLVDNEYVLYIGGKKYTLSQIMGIETGTGTGTVKPSDYELAAGQTTANSVELTWKVPTEDKEAQAGLTYTVYYAKEGEMDTVEKVKANGKVFGSANQKDMFKETITGLEPGTNYTINVVVKDAQGRESVYKPVQTKTKEG